MCKWRMSSVKLTKDSPSAGSEERLRSCRQGSQLLLRWVDGSFVSGWLGLSLKSCAAIHGEVGHTETHHCHRLDARSQIITHPYHWFCHHCLGRSAMMQGMFHYPLSNTQSLTLPIRPIRTYTHLYARVNAAHTQCCVYPLRIPDPSRAYRCV